jgi:hypothetical protein
MWIGRERDEGRARTFPAGTTAALAVIDEADMAGRKKRFLPLPEGPLRC